MLFVDSCSILRWFVNFFMPNNCKNSIVESGYKDLTPLKSGLGAGSVEHAPAVVEHAPNMLKAQLPSPALQKERSAASQETPFPTRRCVGYLHHASVGLTNTRASRQPSEGLATP